MLRFHGQDLAKTTIDINAALGNARTFDDTAAAGRILSAEQVIKRVACGIETPYMSSVNSLKQFA